MKKLKETKKGRPLPSPTTTKAKTNLQTQTRDKQQLESIKLKAPNMTRTQMLGDNDEECTPSNIWERDDKFGE